ncbi:hypothetical protein Ade02nite_04830 [Paractinoplanes deccanensis]|uniref:Uncharacterized protein n=1 Tax=Paractinoplanes deccanensis TaxID=113561 RepID=A0ABQ3XVY9_9ACTN|nr:hypothetical protein [Actinoplanes deccanensis]GID71842.1 hypothetical protein Ade02nite_04830 [Actinoplanes deccanensis]
MVSTPAEVDRLLSAADEMTARAGLGPETRVAVERAVAAARELGDPGRLLHALGRATLNLALERIGDGGDVAEVRERSEEVIALAAGLLADPGRHADAVFRTAQAGQILAATGLAERGREVVERMWRAVAPLPADSLDARRARTAALTAVVTMRLEGDAAELGPLAAEMVDLQRGLARDTGEATAVVDLADALGIFARVAEALRRPDLMRVALTEQYSLAQMFQGARAQQLLEGITASLAALHRAQPDIPVVVPGSGAWRMRGSYLDLLAEAGPSGGGFAARLAAESRVTGPAAGGPPPGGPPPGDPGRSSAGPASGGRPVVGPGTVADCAARLERGVALANADQVVEADRVLAELADELSLHDAATSGATRRDVRRLWAAALYERAMLLHRLGHSDDAWDLAWLSVAVAVRRHEELVAGAVPAALEREALADAATHMVDAAAIADATGRPDDHIMLLSEAVNRCTDATHPRLRRILGTALHNLAAARRDHPETATPLAERARALRGDLAAPDDARSIREYANTLLLTAVLAIDRQDWPAAVDRLATLGPLLAAPQAHPDAMAEYAGQLATEVSARAPELVRRARAEGSWPYPAAQA